MAVWKQLALSLVILVAAAAAWVRFFPGAPEMLASLGHRLGFAATPPTETSAGTAPDGQAAATAAASRRPSSPPAATATINDRLQAIGTGRANASVTVNPYTSGRLTEFLVQSGAHIEKGQVIATLDSDTEEIALERAKIARTTRRPRSSGSSAAGSNAVTAVAVTEAELALRNAKLSLHDAQLALDRRSIVSPIAGIVGILPIEAGNYVTSQSAIATVDDRSSILVDFWVPERFAAAVKVGAQLSATPLANPEGRLCRHGLGHRQPHRREEPHAAGAGDDRQSGRFAARRHVVPGDDEVPRRHLSGRQPAGRSSGARTAPSSGRSRTARSSACRAHHPAQHRDGAGRRADRQRRHGGDRRRPERARGQRGPHRRRRTARRRRPTDHDRGRQHRAARPASRRCSSAGR